MSTLDDLWVRYAMLNIRAVEAMFDGRRSDYDKIAEERACVKEALVSAERNRDNDRQPR